MQEVLFRTVKYEAREAYEYWWPDKDPSVLTSTHTDQSTDQRAWLLATRRDYKFRYWQAVKTYPSRSFAHEGDRLDAFIGLATLYQPAPTTPKDTIALSGLRLAYFGRELQWTPGPPKAASRIQIDARSVDSS